MSIGLVGRKCGMSRIFTEDGESIPVTLIEATPNRVTQVKTEAIDGHVAVQLTAGTGRPARLTKAQKGHYGKAKVEPGRGLWEFRLATEDVDKYPVGGEITAADLFEAGQTVDVSGTSKGKGFQGTIKRHNFSRGGATHGNKLSHRAPGSIGQNQSPGHVFAGKKMSGHMGDAKRTQQGLEIVRVDAERHLIAVKGAIPGAAGGDVIIRPTTKA